MKEFLAHKKTKALLIGFGLLLLGYLGLRFGLLPEDNPDTEANETMQALLYYIGAVVALTGTSIAAQGYSDGRSKGATATNASTLMMIPLLLVGLSGCAATEGVIKAHADEAKSIASLANQHAELINGLDISPADKLELIEEAQIDLDAITAIHQKIGEYLDATDIFDLQDATEWVEIGKQIAEAASVDVGID